MNTLNFMYKIKHHMSEIGNWKFSTSSLCTACVRKGEWWGSIILGDVRYTLHNLLQPKNHMCYTNETLLWSITNISKTKSLHHVITNNRKMLLHMETKIYKKDKDHAIFSENYLIFINLNFSPASPPDKISLLMMSVWNFCWCHTGHMTEKTMSLINIFCQEISLV